MKTKPNSTFWSLFLLVPLLVFSCAERSDDSDEFTENESKVQLTVNENYPYYIRAKVDGQMREFNNPDMLYIMVGSYIPGIFEASIVGGAVNEDDNGSSEGFTIAIKDEEEIRVGSYDFLEPFESTGYGLRGASLGYFTQSNSKTYVSDVDEEDPTFELTELTEKEAKGTFSGRVYDIITKESVMITEGEFYLERIN
ncbi:hypothetical protein [Algoriphagus hitonicola]|uniref:Uncharacterized protein n=1 Tax=Algoriphagus hitonicola TaxID=435880 RepID=A0A1I2WMQ7_9BACT|nr:hypothetical protein [Algoriphagus hitonicola]SFH02668.1 hypothetical protein SAMN04487988_11396 [Algoriphagus hitonicola]